MCQGVSVCVRVSVCGSGCQCVCQGVSVCVRVSVCVSGCQCVGQGVRMWVRVSMCWSGCQEMGQGVSMCVGVSVCPPPVDTRMREHRNLGLTASKPLSSGNLYCEIVLQVLKYKFVREQGDPGHRICHVANEEGVTLIICGTRGLGTIRRTIMGSVSDYVVHHSHCPVIVCRQ